MWRLLMFALCQDVGGRLLKKVGHFVFCIGSKGSFELDIARLHV